jgi:Glycosyltransferase family 87
VIEALQQESWRRALRNSLIVAGAAFNAWFLVVWVPRLFLFVDARSWWGIDLHNLYGLANQSLLSDGAFRLAPIFAWLMYPLTLLSWPVFVAVFTGLNLLAVLALGRGRALLLLIAFPPILLELVNGNIHLFMALAIWAGLRWPAAWAVILLTKVTPGVGVVWFVARREWRNLFVALGATTAIIAAGFVVNPTLWEQWVNSLVIAAGQPQVGDIPSVILRLPFAAALVWYAGRTSRAWLVPFACVLAMPTIWIQSSALLLASFPLYWDRARWQTTREEPASAAQIPAVAT